MKIWASVILNLVLIASFAIFGVSDTEQKLDGLLQLQDGYYLDGINEIGFGNRELDTFECPSSNVITTKYKCKVEGRWVDCTRRHCCENYVFLAGRCVHKDHDPCSMQLCEQMCTVYHQRVICTCFEGYKFSPENQRKGIKPLCVDVNECLDNNGDCEHECINEAGTYRCTCREGFVMRGDNRTCTFENGNYASSSLDAQAALRDHCYANCDTVTRLHDKLKALQEKVTALNTAIRMSSFASGPPGPAGPQGPPGPPGQRGFPGPEGSSVSTGNQDYTYSLLDAFVPLAGDDVAQCKCLRGAQGEPGAEGPRGFKGDQGERGPAGPKGERGSLDFLFLMLADLRHDIVHLQNRVYINGEKPPKSNFETVARNKKSKYRQRLLKQQQLLQGFMSPAVESSSIASNAATETSSKIEKSHTTEEQIEEFRDYMPEYVGEDVSDYDDLSSGLNEEDYI